jgi:hypothetical protein
VRSRAAPSSARTAAHAVGRALVVVGMLIRFVAAVAPLIDSYYFWRLWAGRPGSARRAEQPLRAAVAGAPAVRAQDANDHAGLLDHGDR